MFWRKRIALCLEISLICDIGKMAEFKNQRFLCYLRDLRVLKSRGFGPKSMEKVGGLGYFILLKIVSDSDLGYDYGISGSS